MWHTLEDLDFENLEKVLKEITGGNQVSFQELVQSLMQGEMADYGIKDWVLQAIL